MEVTATVTWAVAQTLEAEGRLRGPEPLLEAGPWPFGDSRVLPPALGAGWGSNSGLPQAEASWLREVVLAPLAQLLTQASPQQRWEPALSSFLFFFFLPVAAFNCKEQ